MNTKGRRRLAQPLREIASQQLRNPQGLLGRLTALIMNRANRTMNALALEALELEADQRVLEIGFGGGDLLSRLTSMVPAGQVAGIDSSADMVSRAAQDPALNTVDLRCGKIEALPYADGSFDRICTVNTVYFWSEVEVALGNVRRVLVPGGRLVIVFQTEETLRRLGVSEIHFDFVAAERLQAQLESAGFIHLRLRQVNSSGREIVVVQADRPAPAMA